MVTYAIFTNQNDLKYKARGTNLKKTQQLVVIPLHIFKLEEKNSKFYL